MKRRQAILSIASAAPCLGSAVETKQLDYLNPYEEVDWESWEVIHSMSHQHQGTTDSSREVFAEMGYRHFAFSNYYPSAPTDLPDHFRAEHPEISWAPNAEQHSFLDTGLHFNSLGSKLATGYGNYLSASERNKAPLEYSFEGLSVFDASRPWEGGYRFDLTLAKVNATAEGDLEALLTIEGANRCNRKEDFADEGAIERLAIPVGKRSFFLRAQSDSIKVRLDYDPGEIAVTQCRLMQGTNRPWREMFGAALDGESNDGTLSGGLLHPDGGGITLNHPTGQLDEYLEMLDFDSRVLGIEVWNQLTSGFGSDRGFYDPMTNPPGHFYQLWDQILSTGRRCWGFFVKDHNTYGRGRNVLLTPPLENLSRDEREAVLLRAYRRGSFFGSVAAIATDGEGTVVAPYDYNEFRFKRLSVKRDEQGSPVAVEAVVGGNDRALRPNVQIRFITEKGNVSTVDGTEGEFALGSEGGNISPPGFVRVEAVAYPDSHEMGKPLTSQMLRKLSVAGISQLHDRYVKTGSKSFGNPAEIRTPIPIVDQIFSQPILRVES